MIRWPSCWRSSERKMPSVRCTSAMPRPRARARRRPTPSRSWRSTGVRACRATDRVDEPLADLGDAGRQEARESGCRSRGRASARGSSPTPSAIARSDVAEHAEVALQLDLLGRRRYRLPALRADRPAPRRHRRHRRHRRRRRRHHRRHRRRRRWDVRTLRGRPWPHCTARNAGRTRGPGRVCALRFWPANGRRLGRRRCARAAS